MEKGIYINGNFFGIQCEPMTEEEKMSKRVSEIDFELEHAKNILSKVSDEQAKLRYRIKYELGLGYNQRKKLNKQIMQHRFIIHGLHTYITVLNAEKSNIHRSNPKNMPPQRTKTEKLLNRLVRIKKRCSECLTPNGCKDCNILDEIFKIEQKLNKLKK